MISLKNVGRDFFSTLRDDPRGFFCGDLSRPSPIFSENTLIVFVAAIIVFSPDKGVDLALPRRAPPTPQSQLQIGEDTPTRKRFFYDPRRFPAR